MLTTLWFQKVKATADAIWCISCLFCVPGVIVATGCMLLPALGKTSDVPVVLIRSLAKPAPSSYAPPPGTGGPSSYRLGLFNREGRLIYEYPDQLIEPTRDAQHGSIVIEIPNDIPTGDYSLRVFMNAGQRVRDVPLNVGASK